MKKLSILFGSPVLNIKRAALCFILGGIIITSCSKTGPAGATGANGATGPSGPVLTGTITGYVILTNQYGAPASTFLNLAYILLKNSSTGATIDSVYASVSGQYTINNVPTGIYNMYCYFPGYGTNVHQNVPFTGGGTESIDNKMAQIPNFNVTTASDSLGTIAAGLKKDNTNVYVSGTIAADAGGERTVLVFIGNAPSPSSNPGTYNFIAGATVPANATNYTVTIPLATMYNNGFVSGNLAYFAVYGASNNYTYGDYTNFTYGQLVYTAISPNAFNATPNGLTLP